MKLDVLTSEALQKAEGAKKYRFINIDEILK